jgi:endonuclease/exonuclease/phosphatase (EEP) superfamily protein YafD
MMRAARILVVASLLPLVAAVWPSDRFPVVALVAYVPPILSGLAAAAALFVFARRSAPLGWTAAGLAALILAVIAVAVDNRNLLAPAPPARGLRIVHWNVAHRPKSAAELAGLDADILCLSEAPREWSPPPHWHAERQGLLVVLARTPLSRIGVLDDSGINALHVVAEGRSILLLDITAAPFVHRRRPLGRLAWSPPPDLVVGDLNTPAGSFSLREALGGFDDAYRRAGRGPGYTWPSLLPLMKIDHMLVRPGLNVLDYTTGFSGSSDHRFQRLVLER